MWVCVFSATMKCYSLAFYTDTTHGDGAVSPGLCFSVSGPAIISLCVYCSSLGRRLHLVLECSTGFRGADPAPSGVVGLSLPTDIQRRVREPRGGIHLYGRQG